MYNILVYLTIMTLTPVFVSPHRKALPLFDPYGRMTQKGPVRGHAGGSPPGELEARDASVSLSHCFSKATRGKHPKRLNKFAYAARDASRAILYIRYTLSRALRAPSPI